MSASTGRICGRRNVDPVSRQRATGTSIRTIAPLSNAGSPAAAGQRNEAGRMHEPATALRADRGARRDLSWRHRARRNRDDRRTDGAVRPAQRRDVRRRRSDRHAIHRNAGVKPPDLDMPRRRSGAAAADHQASQATGRLLAGEPAAAAWNAANARSSSRSILSRSPGAIPALIRDAPIAPVSWWSVSLVHARHLGNALCCRHARMPKLDAHFRRKQRPRAMQPRANRADRAVERHRRVVVAQISSRSHSTTTSRYRSGKAKTAVGAHRLCWRSRDPQPGPRARQRAASPPMLVRQRQCRPSRSRRRRA